MPCPLLLAPSVAFQYPRRRLFMRASSLAASALLIPRVMRPALADDTEQRATTSSPTALVPDWDVPDGHFYTQTAPPDAPAGSGYVVSDADGVLLWSAYRELGGPDLLGYPLSSRFDLEGRISQAFQGGLLQWNADAGRADIAPVFAQLAARRLDDWLLEQGIPRTAPQLLDDPHLPFDTRVAWLTDATLREVYVSLGGADASSLLGLPMSEPERLGPFVAQRFEKGALQRWLEDVPEAPETPDIPDQPEPGTVSLVQAGELLKEAGLLPAAALVSQAAPVPPPAVPEPPGPASVEAQAPPPGAGSQRRPGRMIVVSLGQQGLYAYEDGALVYRSPVTTGRPELPTPRGQFVVLSRHSPFTFVSPWPRGSPYWYPPSPATYALRITGNGVFLHDAPWRTAFGPGTNFPHAGGLRTGSHGCINLPFATAQFLWGFAPIGTPVEVVA